MEIFKTMRQRIMERISPKEIPDPTPLHIPGMDRPLTLREEMQRFIREEISRAAVQADEPTGSFEEEDDFDEEDDNLDFLSEYSVIQLYPEEADYDLDGDDSGKEAPGGETESTQQEAEGASGGTEQVDPAQSAQAT